MVWQICIDNRRAQTNQFQREYEIVTVSLQCINALWKLDAGFKVP